MAAWHLLEQESLLVLLIVVGGIGTSRGGKFYRIFVAFTLRAQWSARESGLCEMLTPTTPCRVDMVLVGAEGVVENGGVINKLGTCVPCCLDPVVALQWDMH